MLSDIFRPKGFRKLRIILYIFLKPFNGDFPSKVIERIFSFRFSVQTEKDPTFQAVNANCKN